MFYSAAGFLLASPKGGCVLERLLGFFGIFGFLFIAYLISSNRKHIPWKSVGVGILLQLVIALTIIGVPAAGLSGPLAGLFKAANDFATNLISYSDEGASFLFGPLLDTEKMGGMVVGLKILPTIIFFSALMAILYHVGVMQKIVGLLAFVMQKTLRTSGAESLATAANIFVGQSEAPLVIKPYLKKMTDSEVFTLMVGGMATVAGGVLAAYVAMLSLAIPDIAGHLLTASVMSVPAAIIVSKMLIPETEAPATLGKISKVEDTGYENLVDAAASGAAEGTRLAINVGGMLIGFIALVALVNGCLEWAGGLFGATEAFGEPLSLELVLGYLFTPFAYMLGIVGEQAQFAGQLLGKKIVLNEFVAYLDLAQNPESLSERNRLVISYALCGFANFSSIAIQIGGIGGIAPSKSKLLAKFGILSMVGGTISACITAAMVGILL